MSDTQYAVALGVVQFDPSTRMVNNQEVTDLTIKTPGSDGKLIRVTVWPEFALPTPPKKGDVVVVDGKVSVNSFEDKNGNKRTQTQISPTALTLIPSIARVERGVVNSADSIF